MGTEENASTAKEQEPSHSGDWVPFTRRTTSPKLNYLMVQLRNADIPFRVINQNRHAPILEIPKEHMPVATEEILSPIDKYPNDHGMFQHYGGLLGRCIKINKGMIQS